MKSPRHWLVAALALLSVALIVVSACGTAEDDEDDRQTADGDDVHAEIELSDEEMERGREIFFNRCAGCHGVLRKGATGLNLEPENTRPKGTAYLKTIIENGTPAGMPEWGKSGILSDDEVDLMARYVQAPVPEPPSWGLEDMKKSHKLHIAPEDRPTEPPEGRDWENYFGVVLRDAGKVAIIDGDSYELINIVDTGFAVHILRSSATGRYFYSIGRDGKVTLIDLWMDKPDVVAEVKAVNDARSIETSKAPGYEDKYAIVGGYWPPMVVVMKGDTLEPIKALSTASYDVDEGEFIREARVAAVVAEHKNPSWVVNIKESGQIWLLDYSKLGDGKGTLSVDMIEAERYLHDGGWDSSLRYFLVAANARNKVAVIDTHTRELIATVESKGITPHPGRGANINHPEFGPCWGTGHIGSNHVTFIGTDPEGHPEYAWKAAGVVELPGVGGGNLFVKTHPNSEHVWADRTLNPDAELSDSLFVIDADTLEFKKQITIPEEFRGHKAVHMEYNRDGTEVWVSAWGRKDQRGAILVYDDKSLKLKKVITGDWMITPTGKFNVWNTVHEIY